MTTHSQLVDEMILETRRPDLRTEISTYVNLTIRELHFTPERGSAIAYRENLRELSLVADLALGYAWTIPNHETFQFMAAVRFDSVFNRDDTPVYVQERTPGRILNQLTEFYYRAGNYFTFAGYGGVDSTISLAYYEYPRRLKYYLTADRPATWDDESGWSYHEDVDELNEEETLAAREKVSNWLLLRWHDVVAEGVRAKVYKRIADEQRSKTSYSLYSQLRNGLFTSEIAGAQDAGY